MNTPVDKSNAPHYNWGEHCDGWHLVQSTELSIIHERMPAGSHELRHCHYRAQQFFFVLQGCLDIEIDGVVTQVNRWQGLHIEPGQMHTVRNAASQPAEFIVVSQPPSHGDRTDTQ